MNPKELFIWMFFTFIGAVVSGSTSVQFFNPKFCNRISKDLTNALF